MKTNHGRGFVAPGHYIEGFPDHGCERYHHADQHRKHRVKRELRVAERRTAARVIEEQYDA